MRLGARRRRLHRPLFTLGYPAGRRGRPPIASVTGGQPDGALAGRQPRRSRGEHHLLGVADTRRATPRKGDGGSVPWSFSPRIRGSDVVVILAVAKALLDVLQRAGSQRARQFADAA